MIYYEWDYETVDSESGDIIDHNHAVKLADFSNEDKTDTLVLVRNEGNETEGLRNRAWAYVVDGKLPEYFTDEFGRPILILKVPNRFHIELSNYIK